MKIGVLFDFLILSLVITAMGCERRRDYSLDEKSFDANVLRDIEKRTGIALPPGSRGLHLFYQGSQIDRSFVGKIEIPAVSEPVVRRSIENIRNEDGVIRGSLADKVSWWRPGLLTEPIVRQFTVGSSRVRAFVGKENGQSVLYLDWNEF
jgi:hypothetical protein